MHLRSGAWHGPSLRTPPPGSQAAEDLGGAGAVSTRRMTRPGPSTTCWRCSRILPGASTWATCATTPSGTWWPATSGCGASTCSIPWAGTPSGCRRRMPPWPGGSTRPPGPTTISSICAASSRSWGTATTGAGSWPPAIRTTTAGSSWSSSRCFAGDWPTRKRPRSIGARSAPRCWPTNRWKRAFAGAAIRRCT